ncbi:TPA: hypothetical protein I7108_003089 [Vibrio cholerae O1]|uniref:hypothetical protein n=1 Tax=Vibrio cholerae TaxID=666 RepID=UPI001184DF1F|nr:hypothetical protein [Vibrio cholerae]HAS2379486.1 hypothetical protein [Vibrio cholerae O1]ELZ1191360.1 hypothetical protein [Vibrio cholerae]MCX9534809.1 hypothetical protein [Vibrio cholerae]MDV2408588.1 hypothetical protein [Vibrio cholerae]TVM80461.1 hypothetical protein FPV46_04970 [Vibrio cholerae]
MLIVQFMTATEYARLSKMGVKQVKARMDKGEIPEVLHMRDGGTRYVDCVNLTDRMLRGELVFSDLSANDDGGDAHA